MKPQIKRLLEDIENNSNKKLTLFSIEGCPACEEFKKKLNKLGMMYENVDMDETDGMWEKLESMGGSDFVPQIMVENHLVKDYEDVNELLSKTITEMVGRKIIIK